MNRKALGKGLAALIPGSDDLPVIPAPATATAEIPIARITSNPYQPRQLFDDAKLEELARSIQENGVIQPIVLRRAPDGDGYQLIAGERRFLAAKRAGRESIPAIVRQASRREMLEFALVENLQREDLNPIDEARAYQRMALEFALTQEQVAEKVGKDRSTVTNALRLLNLPESIQDMVSRGALSTGHARCLLAFESATEQEALASEIVKKGLSVRQVEELAAARKQRRSRAHGRRRIHPSLAGWEEQLRHAFGTQVRIQGGTARGRIEISYFSEEDLERILEVVGLVGAQNTGESAF
jgi:ParB family transcriptional regulator, chromosome partitioning protein